MIQEGGDRGLITALTAHHVRGLQPEHLEVVAARLSCGSADAAAEVLVYSRSQVQRRWNEVKDFILVPLGLPRHDDALAGCWAVLHRGCCVEAAFLLLENDGRFGSRWA